MLNEVSRADGKDLPSPPGSPLKLLVDLYNFIVDQQIDVADLTLRLPVSKIDKLQYFL